MHLATARLQIAHDERRLLGISSHTLEERIEHWHKAPGKRCCSTPTVYTVASNTTYM
jgi:hypothetical protein